MTTFYEKYGISEKVIIRASINGIFAYDDDMKIVKVPVEKIDLENNCLEVWLPKIGRESLYFSHFRKYWGVYKKQLCQRD